MTTGPSQRARQLWLLPVLLITVIATALGGLLARELYAEPEPERAEPVLPTRSAVPETGQPGPSTVQGTTDAVAHPLYGTVRGVLQSYFDAINLKDYRKWSGTVTPDRLKTQPEEQWRLQYRSTRDGSIVVYRIEAGADDTAKVLLSFRSTQDVADAPPELPVGCIQWNVVWSFERARGAWKLGAGPASATPQHEEC